MGLTSTAVETNKNLIFPEWQPATWDDYLSYRDNSNLDRVKLFFNQNQILLEMGAEGINHSSVCDLLTMLFAFWFSCFPDQTAASLGRCLLEKEKTQAAAPDLVLYIGEGIPQWQAGEPRRIDLNQCRLPDLVGEVSDTTLADDLDQKKQLYARLNIPEYWVINIKGKQVLFFQLEEPGRYQQISESIALKGLSTGLIEATLEQLNHGTNISAALWFSQQIAMLKS